MIPHNNLDTENEVKISRDEYARLVDENTNLKGNLERITQQLPRLRQLIEFSADAMILHDASDAIVDCNQCGADMLGMERDDVYEMSLSHFIGNLMHIIYEQIDEKPEGTREKFVGTLMREGGGTIPIEINITAFSDNGERLYVSSIRDISDRVKQADALSESQKKLTQANIELCRANESLSHMAKLKDQFLANMSHELRTPLNAVIGLSEALQMKVYGPVTDKQNELLQTIYDSGEHLLSLINDILDLSKIEANKMELQFDDVDLKSLCDQAIPMVRSQADAKSQSITLSSKGELKEVRADARRIKQVLLNLLSNAVKFTPNEGSIGIDIVACDNDTVELTVWDTGAGIADDQLSILFEPFVQLDGDFNRQHEGTGLGLSLASRFIDVHGGQIKLESEVGKGSRFTVVLPVNCENAVQDNAQFENENALQATEQQEIEHDQYPQSNV